jgi:plasmid replication initiation protein
VRKTHGFKIGALIVVIDELLVELRTRLAEGLANAVLHNQHQGKTATNTQGMVDCTVWRLSILANGAAVKCHVSSTRAARMRTVANRAFCPTTGHWAGGEGDRAGGGC